MRSTRSVTCAISPRYLGPRVLREFRALRGMTRFVLSNCLLFPIYRKREQHIPRNTVLHVSRIDEQHPAADRRPTDVQRSTASRNTVDRLVGLHGIEVPHNLAVACREGTDVAV